MYGAPVATDLCSSCGTRACKIVNRVIIIGAVLYYNSQLLAYDKFALIKFAPLYLPAWKQSKCFVQFVRLYAHGAALVIGLNLLKISLE